nr:hypothetical protein [Desulfuromonas sp. TF]
MPGSDGERLEAALADPPEQFVRVLHNRLSANTRPESERIPEVLYGKCSAGMALEVSLEGGGFFPGTEGKGVFDPPRAELRGVGNLSCIVSQEASFKILCQPGVMPATVGFADQDVDVVEGSLHFIENKWLAGREASGLSPAVRAWGVACGYALTSRAFFRKKPARQQTREARLARVGFHSQKAPLARAKLKA